MSMPGDFVGKLFAMTNTAHRAHLTTGAAPRHMWLDDFYKYLLDASDRYAEVYAGKFEIIRDILTVPMGNGDIVTLVSDDITWIETNYGEITKGNPALQNVVADILEHYYVARYKLMDLV